MLGETPADVEAAAKARTEEKLEALCSQVVDTLESDDPAARAATEVAEKKAVAKSWGKGLNKGILNRPRKSKRRAVTTTMPPKIVAEGAVVSSAAAEKENIPITLSTSGTAKGAMGSSSYCLPADAINREICQVTADDEHPPPMKKKSGDRCASCTIRLPITACLQSKCKCDLLFCGHHLQAHNCSYDYKADQTCRLRAANPEIAPAKL